MKTEIFEYELDARPGEPLVWNVTAAKAAIANGLIEATIAMDPETMREVVGRNRVDPARIAGADPDVPGIGAPIIHAGEVIYVLIDGNHRAARALRDGRASFAVHLLTDAASRACLLRGPREVLP